MKKPNQQNQFFLMFTLLLITLFAHQVRAATGDPVLFNEVFASHTGTDDTEFVELYGIPGTSLEGLSLIVVESDDQASNGAIDHRLDFTAEQVIGSNGFYLIGNPVGLASNYGVAPNIEINANYLENSSFTIVLVETSSITGSSVSGNEVVLDSVGLWDGGATDSFFFNAPIVGPDGPFMPAGARRVIDGVDTDTASDWVLSDFNLGPDNTPVGGDAPPPERASIMEIQGDGQFSPYDGVRVETTGIVTLFTANNANFWLQDGAADDNAMTSDGIFVAGGGYPRQGTRPAVGDVIRIVARVEEQHFGNALPLTRLTSVEEIEIISSGNPLPDPVMIDALPGESIAEAIDFWEPLEGMRVQVEKATVVAPTSGFGEFTMVTKANRDKDSGYFAINNQLVIRSTGINEVDYNPERILVDDSSIPQAIITQPGDKIVSMVGVVDYTFGNYKLQPEQWMLELKELEDEAELVDDEYESAPHKLTVASFNVENLFDLLDEPGKDDGSSTPTPEALDTKLAKLTLAIVEQLHNPDIVVVQEVENIAILQQLADHVNAYAGTGYSVASFETSDGRGIEVGFMWNTARVANLDAYQMTGADVDAAFGPNSASPGREPLVGVFEFNGKEITIIGNHFKSKGGDDPLFGVNWPPIRVTEVQRKLQAHVVRDFVNDLFAGDPDGNVIVTGDLNDFEFGEPGEGEDHPISIVEGSDSEIPLYNLINNVKKAQRYTYIFDGNSQVLDHMLVSPALNTNSTQVRILHFNASVPDAVGEDATTANRSSDHDPILATFKIK